METGKVHLGDFELDRAGFQLTRKGRALRVERIPMELLLLFVARNNQLLSRADIAEHLWGKDVFLDVESSINTAVLKLRKTLGDDPQKPAFIQTVSGKGYRFIGKVIQAGQSSTKKEPKRVMMAVLPFDNLSADPEQEYFSDGLTEETICYLGQVNPNEMGVIARTSSMAYKRTKASITQIGSELGVDYVLESSVRRDGEQMRITSQLIRVSDQTHLWAANFDCRAAGLLDVQRELGMAIAEQVQIKLLSQRGGFAHSPLNMDAYDLYLRGRYQWNQLTPPALRRGIAFFEQAVALNRNEALAWSGLSDCYSMLPITCDEPAKEILPKALAAARRCIELNDGLAEGHSSLGTVKVWMEWDWPGAEAEFRKALELNPSYLQAHRYYACLLSHTGRHDEGALEMKFARDLDPLSPIMHALSGHLRWHARDYPGAMKHLRDAEAINPNLWIVHGFMGRVKESLGRLTEALAEYQKAFDLSGGGNTEALAFKARVQALSGDRYAAEQTLATLSQMPAHKIPPCNIAMIYAGLEDTADALLWLEKGLEIGDVRMVFLHADPRWDYLRAEPRFQALCRRLNLPTN